MNKLIKLKIKMDKALAKAEEAAKDLKIATQISKDANILASSAIDEYIEAKGVRRLN